MALKVAILSVTDHGGAGKAAHRIHGGLLEAGVQSTMLVLRKKTDDDTVKLLPDAGTAWKNAVFRWTQNMARYPNRPRGLETFTDAEADIRFDRIDEVREADVVNLHWIAGLLDYDAAHQVLAEKPSVWTLHDMHPLTGGCHFSMGCSRHIVGCGLCPALGSEKKHDLSRSVSETKLELYGKINARLVAPSLWLAYEANHSSLTRRFPTHHIPYGVPTDIYKPYPWEAARGFLGLPLTSHIVLFGADNVRNRRKGFKHLIGAMEHRVKQGDDVPILFVTFGADPPPVNLPSPHRIIHFGPINSEFVLAHIYSAANVFVIPSEADNLPNTISEAMLCGTPVVGFKIGGIPEMIEHKTTGFLATPFDIEELAEGIQWALSQQPDIRKRCHESAWSKYRPDLQTKAYIELFESIVEGE